MTPEELETLDKHAEWIAKDDRQGRLARQVASDARRAVAMIRILKAELAEATKEGGR